jgi:hypothetical protein
MQCCYKSIFISPFLHVNPCAIKEKKGGKKFGKERFENKMLTNFVSILVTIDQDLTHAIQSALGYISKQIKNNKAKLSPIFYILKRHHIK